MLSDNSYLYGELRLLLSLLVLKLLSSGLQGSYNALSVKHNFKIPHGDVILFSLACGQIMYAFMMRPDTLPHSYNAWIGQAAMIPVEMIDINKGLIREGVFDVASIDDILSKAAVSRTLLQIAIPFNFISGHHPNE